MRVYVLMNKTPHIHHEATELIYVGYGYHWEEGCFSMDCEDVLSLLWQSEGYGPQDAAGTDTWYRP